MSASGPKTSALAERSPQNGDNPTRVGAWIKKTGYLSFHVGLPSGGPNRCHNDTTSTLLFFWKNKNKTTSALTEHSNRPPFFPERQRAFSFFLGKELRFYYTVQKLQHRKCLYHSINKGILLLKQTKKTTKNKHKFLACF